ncbi:hypothetical protein NHQ30_009397 [Ciborinia camelliae]|nr:hypothetical protein NHQ30_009397 [Ciborinia camelliae]
METVLQNQNVKHMLALAYPRRALVAWKTFNMRKLLPLLKVRASKLRTSAEPAKVALVNKRRFIILDFLFHLLPIAITISLVCLSIPSVYWTDVQAEDKWLSNILNALNLQPNSMNSRLEFL